MNIVRNTAIILAAATAFASSPALAADSYATQDEIASAIEVGFGAKLTSTYMSRGVAQTTGPAIQGYIEPSYGIFYVGVWASNVSFAPDQVEINLYGGIRPQFGALTLDLGYARYYYDRTGDLGGEFYAKANYAFMDEFSGGVELYYDPTNRTNYGVVSGEVSLPENFAISAGVGTWFDGNYDWNAGVSYTFQELVTLDVRYHDSNHSPSRVVASLSFDSSFAFGR